MKKTIYFFILVFIIGGLFSCSNDFVEPINNGLKENMTDAEILKWQKSLWPKTKGGDAPIGILVTTKANITCGLNNSDSVVVSWGDGHIDTFSPPYSAISHTYTDDLPGHTITFTGTNSSITNFYCNSSEIIYADFSKSTNLLALSLYGNKLTTIYLNDNFNLKELDLGQNKLSALNIDNLIYLKYINIAVNPISSINVKSAGNNLTALHVNQTSIINLDISENKNLKTLIMKDTKINPTDLSFLNKLEWLYLSELYSQIDLTHFPLLYQFDCRNSQIKSLDFSNNSLITSITCRDSDVEEIILPDLCSNLYYVDIYQTPIEQKRRNIMNLAYSLPDQTNKRQGTFITISPYIENFREDVEAYSWRIIP